jgi:hypothetical protein
LHNAQEFKPRESIPMRPLPNVSNLLRHFYRRKITAKLPSKHSLDHQQGKPTMPSSKPSFNFQTLINPITSFFTSAASEDKQPQRDRKSYENNVTASLSLQLFPQKKKTAAPVPDSSTSIMTSAFQTMSFISSSAVSLVSSAISTAPTTPTAAPALAAAAEKKPAKKVSARERDDIKTQIEKLQRETNAALEILKDPTAPAQAKTQAQAALDKQELAKVKLVEPLIKEHAARRVDLFFYLLVAVYNQKALIKKDVTNKQHGSGSKLFGTEACHSSLFPNIELTQQASWNYFQKVLSLRGTHFEHTLNMTVELPRIVNKFDCVLEGNFILAAHRFIPSIYNKNSLVILNKVATGELDPKTGMDEFLNNLKDFFNKVEKDYLTHRPDDIEEKDLFKYSAAFKRVWELQKEGSFAICKENTLTTCVNDEYIYLMLRIHPESRWKVALPGYLTSCYTSIQSEIFNTKAENIELTPTRPKP